jgi:hypothetical protein
MRRQRQSRTAHDLTWMRERHGELWGAEYGRPMSRSETFRLAVRAFMTGVSDALTLNRGALKPTGRMPKHRLPDTPHVTPCVHGQFPTVSCVCPPGHGDHASQGVES